TSPCLDVFVAKLNASGTALSYSSYLGGVGNEFVDSGSSSSATTIALDSSGNAYVTASTTSPSFPTTNTAFKGILGPDGFDGFVAKIATLCALRAATSVTICRPGNGTTVHSPVTIIAGTNDSRPVKLLQIYIDGKKKYEAGLSAFEVKLPLAAGSHRLTLQAVDVTNFTFKSTAFVTVAP